MTVDIQNTRRNVVISAQVLAPLPSGRSAYNVAVLVPGISLSGGASDQQDVGGAQNMTVQTYSIHGNRALDQRLQINGLTMRHILASAASNFVPDMGAAAGDARRHRRRVHCRGYQRSRFGERPNHRFAGGSEGPIFR